jgi:hypothetical protein
VAGKRQRRKPGPKPKIGDRQAEQVYAILAVGGSLNDAADVLGIGRQTLNDRLAADPEFRKGVDRSVAEGKTRLIRKVGNATTWRAAAWMLERKWGREFGRRDFIHQEITGPGGGPQEHVVNHNFDHDRFAELYRRRTEGGIVVGGGSAPPNGN